MNEDEIAIFIDSVDPDDVFDNLLEKAPRLLREAFAEDYTYKEVVTVALNNPKFTAFQLSMSNEIYFAKEEARSLL